MSLEENNGNTKHVVIIGGGYGGCKMASILESKVYNKNVKITLIEKRKYMFHSVGALRAIVDESYVPMVFIPLSNLLKYGCSSILEAEATILEKNQVTVQLVESGEQKVIRFDYLIIATGSSYAPPIKPAKNDLESEICEEFHQIRQKVKKASSFLIVGGGAVGVEFAGEIASKYPSKKVTIVDRNKQLISGNRVTARFRSKLLAALEKLNVEVILGDGLKEQLLSHSYKRRTFFTESGKEIESDIQFVCAGFRPNTSLVENFNSSLVESESKKIRVKSNMQVDNYNLAHWYVIGDASNHPTPKLGYWAQQQATALAQGLAACISNPSKDVPPFNAGTEVIVVPLGPKGGVGQLPLFGGFTVGNFITRNIKSNDLFAKRFWSELDAELI